MPPPIPAPLTGTVSVTNFVNADYTVPGVSLPSGKPFHYEIMMPSQYSTNFIWPLWIYLHPDTAGNSWYNGNTGSKLSNSYGGPLYQNVAFQTKYPGICIVPYADQTTASSTIENWGGWINTGATGDGSHFNGETGPNTFGLNGLVQHLIATLSIDPNRIYVQGFSLGGIGAEYFMLRYNQVNGNPKIYTAGTSTGGVLEIHGSGAGPSTADVTTMTNVPVWWISGQNDGTSIPTHWNTIMWQRLAGNTSYPALNSSEAGSRAGTSKMHFWYVAGVGHSATDGSGKLMESYTQVLDYIYAQNGNQTPPTQAARCGDFFNTLCIQGRLSSNTANYNDPTGFANDAASIGARHWRDTVAIGSGQLNVVDSMRAKGISMVATAPYGTVTPASVLASAKILLNRGAGTLYALESVNDPTNGTITYNGNVGGQTNSWHSIADFTKDYYTLVKGDSTVSALPFFGVSEAGGETDDSSLQFLVVPSPKPIGTYEAANVRFADYFNQHVYPMVMGSLAAGVVGSAQSIDVAAGNQFYTDLHYQAVQTARFGFAGYATDAQAQAQPRVVTECGYHTVTTPAAGSTDIDAITQGKCLVNALLNAWSLGYLLFNIFELYDQAGYGLFSSNGVAKVSGRILQNFATILNDVSAANRTFTVGSLAFTIAGLPAQGNRLLLQNSAGDLFLVLWTYASNWNVSTGKAITVTASSVTVTLATQTFPTIQVLDPTVGVSPIATASGSVVTVSLRDSPIIIKFPGTNALKPYFTVSNGKVLDTNGNVYIGAGINIRSQELSNAVTNAACQPLTTLFPGINIVRLAYEGPGGTSTYDTSFAEPYVSRLTALGIVVEIEDHTGISKPPYTGTALTNETNWYRTLATTYKSNPYVWFGEFNEPSDGTNITGIWTQTQAIYNAIRGTGNDTIFAMLWPSGGTPGTIGINGRGFDGSGPMTSSAAGMHNLICDFHFYDYAVYKVATVATSSTDIAVITSCLVGDANGAAVGISGHGYGVRACQSITSDDGTIPVFVGETGDSTDGTNIDPNGTQIVTAVGNELGRSIQGVMYWDWVSSGAGDKLTNGSGAIAGAYGTQVKNIIAAAAAARGSQGFLPSPNNTVVIAPSTALITDSNGDRWGIVSGQVAKNGITDTSASNVIELAYVNGVVWRETAGGNWSSNTLGAWSTPTNVSPLPPVSADNTDIVAPSNAVITDAAFNTWGISSSGQLLRNSFITATPGGATVLTPTSGGSIKDGAGNTWTLPASGVATENGTGVQGGGGTSAITVFNGTLYAQDAATGSWYTWNGTMFVAAASPPPTGSSTVVEIAYVGGLIWEKDTAGNWYSTPGTTPIVWTGPTTTSPVHAAPGGLAYIKPFKTAGLRVITYIQQESPASFATGFTKLRNEQSANHDIAYYEGCQEPDTAVLTGTPETVQDASSFQQTVWSGGQTDSLPVIQTSFGIAANYGTTGDLSAFATYGNAHTYTGTLNCSPNDGPAPGFLSSTNAAALLTTPGKRVAHTEFGWRSDHNSAQAVAAYVLDFVMSAYFDLDAPLFLVQGLYDDSSGAWGIYNNDQTPRMVATALDNLYTLLADTASNALSFGPGKLNVSFSNLPTGTNPLMGGHFGVLQKSDGSFWIMLRNEQTLTNSDANNHTPITVANVSTTMTLGTLATSIAVYNVTTGTTAVQTAANTTTLTISLPPYPILIRVVRP